MQTTELNRELDETREAAKGAVTADQAAKTAQEVVNLKKQVADQVDQNKKLTATNELLKSSNSS